MPCRSSRIPPKKIRLRRLQDASKTRPHAFFFVSFLLLLIWIAFLSIVDANLAPTCLQKSTKIHEKTMPRAILILAPFLIDVGSILQPTWPYFGRVVGAKLGPTGAQLAPKPYSKITRKMITSWTHFGSIFGRFWIDFGELWGSSVDDLGVFWGFPGLF